MHFEIGQIKVSREHNTNVRKDILPFDNLEKELRSAVVPPDITKLKNIVYDYNFERELIISGFSDFENCKISN